jgi:glycerol kinase
MSSPASALYLAIDQGGQSSRALVLDGCGALVAEASTACAVSHPKPQWVEQDADELASSVTSAVAQALHRLAERSADVIAAGLATQRSSIACWDRSSDKALAPVLSWQDTRAHAWLEQFGPQADDIRRRTGLPLSAHYGASKLRWCLDNLPPVRTAQTSGRLAYGPLASWLLWRLLSGRPLLVDPANAGRTLLWNVRTHDWDLQLLALFGLPRAALPQCVPSRYAFGELATGTHRIPLRVTTGDQSAALFAFAAPDEETAYVNIGTGAFVQRLARRRPADVGPFLASVVFSDDRATIYALEGTVNGAASALRWLEQTGTVRAPETHLPQWLQQVTAPPLFLNGVSGLGSPYWVADFPSRFIGQGTAPEQAVAVVESIVFLLQDNLQAMGRFARPPRQIRISGGLARLDGLCQRLADITALPVNRPGQCEATARGLAYLLAKQPASWPDPAGGQWFRPQLHVSLQERYRRWQAAMQAALAPTRTHAH